MPNNRSRGDRDFSRFDAMTDEELEQVLRLDEQNTEGSESDLEETLYVMEVLAERNKYCLSAGKTVEEAFESFQKNYMPHEDSENTVEDKTELEVVSTPSPKSHRWLHRLSSAAAAIAVVVVCSLTASAFGFDIWETIAKWTQETFHFGDVAQVDESEPVRNDEQNYTTLQEALEQQGTSAALAPRWFPEGYELVDVIIDETPMRLSILAIYQNGDHVIKVQIIDYLDADPQQVERSDSLVETYESNGITYYIFADNTQLRAVWINDQYECYVSGQLSIEEMKTMIDSIAKE